MKSSVGGGGNGPEGPPADVTVSVRVAEHDDNTKREISGGSKREKRGGKDKEKDPGKDKKASGSKRKVETAEDIYAQEIGNKSAKRGKKTGGGRRSGGR